MIVAIAVAYPAPDSRFRLFRTPVAEAQCQRRFSEILLTDKMTTVGG